MYGIGTKAIPRTARDSKDPLWEKHGVFFRSDKISKLLEAFEKNIYWVSRSRYDDYIKTIDAMIAVTNDKFIFICKIDGDNIEILDATIDIGQKKQYVIRCQENEMEFNIPKGFESLPKIERTQQSESNN